LPYKIAAARDAHRYRWSSSPARRGLRKEFAEVGAALVCRSFERLGKLDRSDAEIAVTDRLVELAESATANASEAGCNASRSVLSPRFALPRVRTPSVAALRSCGTSAWHARL
jgi:hypothetical protein